MIDKPTDRMLHDLLTANELDQYMKDNGDYMAKSSIAKLIDDLISARNMSKAEVIKSSEINEIYAYQIFAGKRTPSRDKLISLCFGMKLSFDETQDLLKRAGFAPLYTKNKRDSVIAFSINNHFTVVQLNNALYQYDLKTL